MHVGGHVFRHAADRLYLILRRDFKMAVAHRETTPKLLGGDVCSVLYSDILLNGADETPELLLH